MSQDTDQGQKESWWRRSTRACEQCGKPLGRLTLGSVCSDCGRAQANQRMQAAREQREQLKAVEDEIVRTRLLTDSQLQLLSQQPLSAVLQIYNRVLTASERAGMDEHAVTTVTMLVERFHLPLAATHWEDRVQPYLYAVAVQNGHSLPAFTPPAGVGMPLLRKGETVHFAAATTLKELKSTSRYVGHSQGVSFPIGDVGGWSIRYRVGSSRGHVVREEHWTPTSSGVLYLTN